MLRNLSTAIAVMILSACVCQGQCFIDITKNCSTVGPTNIGCWNSCISVGTNCGLEYIDSGLTFPYIDLVPAGPDTSLDGFEDLDPQPCGLLVNCICYPDPLGLPVIGINICEISIFDLYPGWPWDPFPNATIMYALPKHITGDICPDEE